MRIERVHIDDFGRLRDFDSGPDALGGLVVVVGPNEAGKSTLFNFLSTALYGFHPASREKNPHVPWGAEEAGGWLDLSLADGRSVRVARKLRANPKGRLIEGDVSRDMRNRPVPWVDHVPRGVFRSVYAVTLRDLAALDPETWAQVQDRIVGSMGTPDLRSARRVAEELEEAAAAVWRPTRRGKQTLRLVQEDLRSVHLRRSAARERDRLVRGLVEERENARVQLRELREERHAAQLAAEQAQELAPLHARMIRIEALRSQGGDRGQLDGLPPDPVAALEQLGRGRSVHCTRASELEEELVAPEESIRRFGERQQVVLSNADRILRAAREAAEVAPDRRRVDSLGRETEQVEAKLVAAGEQLFTNGWSEELAEPVRAVPLDVLRDRVARAGVEAPASAGPRPPLAWAALIVGGALLVAGSVMASTALAIAGTGVAAGAAVLLATRGAGGPGGPSDRGAVEIVKDLPIRPEYLDPVGDPLASALARLADLVREHDVLIRDRDAAQSRVQAADRSAADLSDFLGRPGGAAAEDTADALARDLREAERLRDAAALAGREAERLRRDRDRELAEATRLGSEIEALRSALVPLGDGDEQAGAERGRRRIAAHRRADQLEEELERDYPGSAGAADYPGDEEVARLRARVEELSLEIEELIARGEALERDAAHLREKETVDAVDGEIEALTERAAEMARERDRKWALATLLREADRRFREAHQPDLLRRASEHLARLTEGRYDRLLVDEARPDLPFQLAGPGLPAPVALAPPISTGTLEQAYLGLRLAIVDHLDLGHEQLPLFVDEIFVNWDATRRAHGLRALAGVAATRQTFVFTCHQSYARELEALGAVVLEMGAD